MENLWKKYDAELIILVMGNVSFANHFILEALANNPKIAVIFRPHPNPAVSKVQDIKEDMKRFNIKGEVIENTGFDQLEEIQEQIENSNVVICSVDSSTKYHVVLAHKPMIITAFGERESIMGNMTEEFRKLPIVLIVNKTDDIRKIFKDGEKSMVECFLYRKVK